MSNESSTLFKPLMFNQPLTVLLLLENSQKIFSVWRELREHYLNPLIDTILRVNNQALTSLALIESSADANGARHPPRQIPLSPAALNVNFDFTLDGRISPSRVNDCIQHLDQSTYPFDGSAALHLIIVAASTPSDDCSGITSPTGANSPWWVLAEKLSERNIHCHLIAASGEDVSPLTYLFDQTLYLQNNVEELPPFPIDQERYIFRFSARPFYPPISDLEQNASAYVPVSNAMAATSRINCHLDSHFDRNFPPPSSGTAFTPQNEISIVSHLKFAQGLIKKKQHSKDPQPAPFIAEERVQDSSSQPYPSSSPPSLTSPSSTSSSSSTLSSSSPPISAATSLSSIPLTSRHRKPQSLAMAGFSNVPPEAMISPTNGGRAMSISKADRKQRVSQASSGSSPTDLVHAHMRRGSQAQLQGAVGVMNAPGQGGSSGSWFGANNSHGLPQIHGQRGSPLSTSNQDVSMSSPALAAGSLRPGVIGTSSSSAGRGGTLDGGVNMGVPVGSEVVTTDSSGNHDISPGSVSSYVSSDMSSPTTPGSTEDLSSYARMHAFHRQGITYQMPYQQDSETQDPFLHQQQSMQQMQEDSYQEQMLQLYQTAAVQQSNLYPGAYDPSSNYFPAQSTVPTQQYYLPRQGESTQQSLESVYQPGVSGAAIEPIQDGQTQQSSIPLGRRQPQTLRHNPYSNARPAATASPPPMIVPSQSHVPLTAVNLPTAAPSTTDTAVIPRSSPPRPAATRAATGQQGRTRASTVASSSNLKNSKVAKSKRHKKSASSVSHSALHQSTVDPPVLSSVPTTPAVVGGDEIFEVPPLYAASTGVLFESMFNIKSGLLDGPSALANPEDVALVAPALGVGEGPNVMTTLPSDAVETAGGLFRSRLKERGGVVDEVSGTALVPVPSETVTGPLHGDSPTGVGQSLTANGDMFAIQSYADATSASMSRSTYPLASLGSASIFPYLYEDQQVSYGTFNGQPH